jgi:hypothetical protein
MNESHNYRKKFVILYMVDKMVHTVTDLFDKQPTMKPRATYRLAEISKVPHYFHTSFLLYVAL